jgi:hypothetical protein
MQPTPDTRSICQKFNYVEKRQQKAISYQMLECPPRSSMHVLALFLTFDETWLGLHAVNGTGSTDEVLSV